MSGFSFQGQLREPFDRIIEAMISSKKPIVSVDVPSGWAVDSGPSNTTLILHPTLLVSLSAPKLSSQHYAGKHYLGGRFIPPWMEQKYNLGLPPFEGASQIVQLSP